MTAQTDDPKMRAIIDNKRRRRAKNWKTSADNYNESKIVGAADRFWADPSNRIAFGLSPLVP